jgi:hypothetical protein
MREKKKNGRKADVFVFLDSPGFGKKLDILTIRFIRSCFIGDDALRFGQCTHIGLYLFVLHIQRPAQSYIAS